MGKRIDNLKDAIKLASVKRTTETLEEFALNTPDLGQPNFLTPPPEYPRVTIKINRPAMTRITHRTYPDKETVTDLVPRAYPNIGLRGDEDLYIVNRHTIRENGNTPEKFMRAWKDAQEARKKKESIKKLKNIELEKRTNERNRFPEKYIRFSHYLFNQRYRKELMEDASRATLEELQETILRLTNGENGKLSPSQRTTAITYLQLAIDKKNDVDRL